MPEPAEPGHGDPGAFTARARELPTAGIEEQIGVYSDRWPTTAPAITAERFAAGTAHHRLYQLEVTGWVLYDERNFKGDPRRPVTAHP